MKYTTENFFGLLLLVIGLVLIFLGVSYFFKPILFIVTGLLFSSQGLKLAGQPSLIIFFKHIMSLIRNLSIRFR